MRKIRIIVFNTASERPGITKFFQTSLPRSYKISSSPSVNRASIFCGKI